MTNAALAPTCRGRCSPDSGARPSGAARNCGSTARRGALSPYSCQRFSALRFWADSVKLNEPVGTVDWSMIMTLLCAMVTELSMRNWMPWVTVVGGAVVRGLVGPVEDDRDGHAACLGADQGFGDRLRGKSSRHKTRISVLA